MRSVAIVDDDPAIRTALARLVRSLGHQTLSFETAEDFLAALDATTLDCVVTDVQMPGLSGIDLLRQLHERRPRLPVIVVTAYPSRSNRERAVASGAFAYLPKPFDADDFERCLSASFTSA